MYIEAQFFFPLVKKDKIEPAVEQNITEERVIYNKEVEMIVGNRSFFVYPCLDFFFFVLFCLDSEHFIVVYVLYAVESCFFRLCRYLGQLPGSLCQQLKRHDAPVRGHTYRGYPSLPQKSPGSL